MDQRRHRRRTDHPCKGRASAGSWGKAFDGFMGTSALLFHPRAAPEACRRAAWEKPTPAMQALLRGLLRELSCTYARQRLFSEFCGRGAFDTLRNFGGAAWGRGSASSLVARCCSGTRAGVEPGPPKAWRGGRIRPKPPVPPKGGTAATPSGLGGTRSTASNGGTPFAESLGPGGTGPSIESLPTGRGETRPSNGQCSRVSNPSGGLWKAGAGW